MKVKTILETLKNIDPETEIHFSFNSGCCGDYMNLVINDIEIDIYKDFTFVNFRFNHIPGYYSCRQAAATIKEHEEYWTRLGKKDPYWKDKK